jgi:hypothetical protein
MTRPLTTPYHIGDRVVILLDDVQRRGRAVVGDVGTIRRLVISDPNDGDETFLMFYVAVASGRLLLHASEFAPAAEAEAYLWARRQVDGALAPKAR